MSTAAERIRAWAVDVDRLTLPALTRLTQVDTTRERARLEQHDLAYVGGPTTDGPPDRWQLDQAARFVIGSARASAAIVGGVAGLAGAFGMLPEYAAQLVGVVRLAQRLALVHGIDPKTDVGRLAVGEAVSFGLGVPLPPGGIAVMRVSEVVTAIRTMPSAGLPVPVQVVTSIAIRSTQVGTRLARFAPVVASGVAAIDGQERMARIGWRMHAWFADSTRPLTNALIEDAIEVEPG